MRRRDLVFAAPQRRTGNLAQTLETFIGVHSHQQERRFHVRTQAAADLELGDNRHVNGYGLNGCYLHGHIIAACALGFTGLPRQMLPLRRMPYL